MRGCNFTWIAKDGDRVKCTEWAQHGMFHIHGDEKIVVGMEMYSKSPSWEVDENHEGNEWSAAHSSNYGKDSV